VIRLFDYSRRSLLCHLTSQRLFDYSRRDSSIEMKEMIDEMSNISCITLVSLDKSASLLQKSPIKETIFWYGYMVHYTCLSGVSCLDHVSAALHHRTTAHCNTLQHTATQHCNTLGRTERQKDIATHCSTLQHTATHCHTLQRIATHCNTPQHAATYLQMGRRR